MNVASGNATFSVLGGVFGATIGAWHWTGTDDVSNVSGLVWVANLVARRVWCQTGILAAGRISAFSFGHN